MRAPVKCESSGQGPQGVRGQVKAPTEINEAAAEAGRPERLRRARPRLHTRWRGGAA